MISPRSLRLPGDYKLFMRNKKIEFKETNILSGVLSAVDVLYITRIQKERFPSMAAYNKVEDAFIIDNKILKKLKKKAVIMHPLPRLAEINTEIDGDPRAAYFRQAQNGLYVRMALLQGVLGK